MSTVVSFYLWGTDSQTPAGNQNVQMSGPLYKVAQYSRPSESNSVYIESPTRRCDNFLLSTIIHILKRLRVETTFFVCFLIYCSSFVTENSVFTLVLFLFVLLFLPFVLKQNQASSSCSYYSSEMF